MTSPPITVLVADDDALVRRAVVQILSSAADIEVTEAVSDGDEVPAAIDRRTPDVVLLDLKMQRLGGLETIGRLMSQPHPPKIVVMTAMDVDELVLQAVTAGAHSFLSKSEAPETFLQAVRAVAAGNTLFSTESLRKIVATNVSATNRIAPSLAGLTAREIDVLRVMALGASNTQIAAELFISETTAKTHLASIAAKLGTGNRVEAALAAYRAGLVV